MCAPHGFQPLQSAPFTRFDKISGLFILTKNAGFRTFAFKPVQSPVQGLMLSHDYTNHIQHPVFDELLYPVEWSVLDTVQVGDGSVSYPNERQVIRSSVVCMQGSRSSVRETLLLLFRCRHLYRHGKKYAFGPVFRMLQYRARNIISDQSDVKIKCGMF